ncbi:MAG: N-acetylmuramoyl-L-alanine amidase [Deltaproteobacteria bacterium]|nr:N-acetylmuramoyl-L-alanine amidase [Deltaproteobacteria bacterium]
MSTPKVVLAFDLGHGGTNHGCDVGDVLEKDYVLERGLLLQEMSEACGVETFLIRSDDKTLSFAERAAIADSGGATHVFSLHVNSSANRSWHGALCLAYPGNRAMKSICESISSAMPSPLKRYDGARWATPELWGDSHAVLSAFRQPTALIELGFGSNVGDLVSLFDVKLKVLSNLAICAGAVRL